MLGEAGNQGVLLTNLNDDGTIKKDAIRINFDIDKDTTKRTNKSKIKIWNLSDDTLDKIEKNDLFVELYVGYKDSGLKRIFIGYALTVETKNDNGGKDIVTEITAADGQVQIRDAIMSVGYPAGINSKVILNGIASTMGLDLFVADDVDFPDYPDGFSFVGYAKDALDIVVGGLGGSWSVQNEVLQVILSEGTTGLKGLVFNADSGLIGFPERLVRSAYATAKQIATATAPPKLKKNGQPRKQRAKKAKKQKKQKQYGWRTNVLLAPTTNPGDGVRIESDFVTGWLKIESLKHSGDTHSNDWNTQLELIEVLLDE
jgi:hypothetical protein